MKEPIEKIVKKSLEQHEMPYKAAAWTSMQAKLDAKATPPASNWKYFGAAGLAIIAASSYFFFAGENQTTKNQQAKNTIEEVINKPETSSHTKSVKTLTAENTSTSNSSEETTVSVFEADGNEASTTTNGSSELISSIENIETVAASIENPLETTSEGSTDNSSSEETANRPSSTTKSISIPSIDNMCLGQATRITNENEQSIFVKEPNGGEFELTENSTDNYKSSQTGRHLLGYYDGADFVESASFMVNEIPDANFSVDLDTKFEDGLPTTHVESTSLGESFMWNAEGRIIHGETADIHFYKEGLHNVTLEVSNGKCKSRIEKQVKVDQYNLMAMNAFNPNSSDARNSTFMPYALTLRNTSFRMIIIDSRDGGVVYETTDAGLPWNGVDNRTGKTESSLTTYIWKVVLESPELGEPAEYKGTLIKL